MSSKSHLSYSARAAQHSNLVARRLFEIAESKKSNVTVSADLTTSSALLDLADRLGPYIVVLKTHIDIITDFSQDTISRLKQLAKKHSFLIFEDRKFVDIGSTVQKQYHGGTFRISEWADIVNASILAGEGIIEALAQSAHETGGEKAILILAEMTSKGSLATGDYTRSSVEIARKYPSFVLGFIATRELSSVKTNSSPTEAEDFTVFTTGVNVSTKGDALGQQYQTPQSAIAGGADFIIAGRGIYAATDPEEAVKLYQKQGWDAYMRRIQG